MAAKLSYESAGCTLLPKEDSWYSFLLEAKSTPRVIVRLEGLIKVKCKPNPVTDRGGLQGCEISRIPHYLDRLTDGSEVVNITRRPRFTPQKHFLLFLVLISVTGWVNPRGWWG
jgi:hypothetical protein